MLLRDIWRVVRATIITASWLTVVGTSLYGSHLAYFGSAIIAGLATLFLWPRDRYYD